MKTYTIPKGRHKPFGFRFKRYKGSHLVIFARFHRNCWHYPSDIPKSGKNKLAGITFGFKGIHTNSIRIAWQPDPTQNIINLFAYIYNNGNRHIKPIGSVAVEQPFMLRINFAKDFFCIRFANAELKFPFQFPKTPFSYINFPWFGGNAPTPWDMKISLKIQETTQWKT